jgi:hypothetical protein
MRGRTLGGSAITVLLLVASCRFPTSSQAASCDEDVALCPQSSKSATSVTCDCRCTIGFSEDTGQTFEGHIAMCLPPALNGAIAAGAQQAAAELRAVEPRVFDQRVFQFCSKDVAGFLRSWIHMPGHLALGCASPVSCDCSTGGTQIDSEVCRAPCDDVACDARNCAAVLGRDSKVDLSSCFCSRAASCGSVTPSVEAPPLCRDWMQAPASTPPRG